jgi:alanine-glyoxylate transaminase / serine-glyoxylate transaminase / serine-pyruvate transaminase
MPIKSFVPPNRILMGPGPSNVHPRVLEAMSRPTIGHLDPQFIKLMDEIKELLRYIFKTKNELTFPVSGPGSVGMETCLVNLVEPGMKVIVCINGVFGGRMKEIIERSGATAVVVEAPWGEAISPEILEDALKNNPDVELVAFVQAETSTGALSDAKTLVEIAHKYNCLTIVDAVTSLGGVPVKVDEWKIDAIYSGSQKCLSCPPGLSPVSFNQKSLDWIKNRKHKVQSWFMDTSLVISYWGSASKRSYHHTAPINALYGLHEALLMLHEEGIENSWQRHKNNSEKFITGLKKLGLEIFVKEGQRLPELITVRVPEDTDDAGVRNRLLNEFNIEIGAGLGVLAGKIWRIGLMGYTSNDENITACLSALKQILNK